MTHETFAEKLLDLAYGELPPREAGKVEAHAASCEVCRAELARIRETRSLMAGLPEEPAPERGQGILLAAACQEAERRTAKRRLPPWLLRTSLVAASLVAVAAVSYRIVSMRPGPLSAKGEREALDGESYVRAPEAPPPAREEAPRPERAGAEPLAADRASPSAATPARPEAKRSAPREEGRARAFAEPPPALAAAPSVPGHRRAWDASWAP
jgi:hypothetical protein